MTRAAKIVYGLALAIGLCAGAAVGFSIGRSEAKFEWDGMTLGWPIGLRTFAIAQSRYADAGQAREALLTYIDVLEQLDAYRPKGRRQSEIAECYVRLAMLEDQSGNKERAHELFESARNLYASAGSVKAAELSDAELEAAFLKGDQIREQHGLPY